MKKVRIVPGHVYGLKTRKGIALMQLVEEPISQTDLWLTRICDGFLQEDYTQEDIISIIERKELFFMGTPLPIIGPRSKLYKMFFAFDQPCKLPDNVVIPSFLRGFVILRDGTIKWYKKRRGSNYRVFVDKLTPDFLKLSPDSFWSFPDLCEFLESGKTISDYI